MKGMHIISTFKSALMVFENATFYFGCHYSYCVDLPSLFQGK